MQSRLDRAGRHVLTARYLVEREIGKEAQGDGLAKLGGEPLQRVLAEVQQFERGNRWLRA